jgi:hypothetical protein
MSEEQVVNSKTSENLHKAKNAKDNEDR